MKLVRDAAEEALKRADVLAKMMMTVAIKAVLITS